MATHTPVQELTTLVVAVVLTGNQVSGASALMTMMEWVIVTVTSRTSVLV